MDRSATFISVIKTGIALSSVELLMWMSNVGRKSGKSPFVAEFDERGGEFQNGDCQAWMTKNTVNGKHILDGLY